MKELSIEEKAKRYDEAIKRVENIKTGKCQKTFVFTEGLFEHIFPALKESEDEKIRKDMIDTIKQEAQDFPSSVIAEKSNSWIAWLEKQGEKKPVEWSEEDEEHIDSLLKRLDALCRNKFERTRFAISEDRDWLKSLRPQNYWKPSEKQMEQLGWVAEQNKDNIIGKELMTLYKDLKKLKG